MGRYLLDTNVFIMWLKKDETLDRAIYNIINSHDNTIYISAATIWEIDMKRGVGEIQLDNIDINTIIENKDFKTIEISSKSASIAKSLAYQSDDPFNRTIIAHAIQGNLILITLDHSILKFDGVKTLKL